VVTGENGALGDHHVALAELGEHQMRSCICDKCIYDRDCGSMKNAGDNREELTRMVFP
jgi:hypothetical protein